MSPASRVLRDDARGRQLDDDPVDRSLRESGFGDDVRGGRTGVGREDVEDGGERRPGVGREEAMTGGSCRSIGVENLSSRFIRQ